MSALDTFQWLVADVFHSPDEPTRKMIDDKRDYLFTLRSEDERQRFVDSLVREFKVPKNASESKNYKP